MPSALHSTLQVVVVLLGVVKINLKIVLNAYFIRNLLTCSEEWQIEIHSVYFFSNISVFYFIFSEKNTYVMLWQINNDVQQQEIQTVFVLFTQQ